MSLTHTNRLIYETSPYLLQHAHNPVDWYPWGDEAFEKATKENKPVLVSIGYAACHWCHVMERESFEDEETAALMNRNFVNIKIDREERPDLDHIYMDAVQAMTGGGGWPLNVFLTPDRKPFYGGTYFPPQRAFNRPSWTETLLAVSTAFREKRGEIDSQAENLTDHLSQSNSFGLRADQGKEIFAAEKLQEAFQNIMKSADTVWGGFGKAPKFPQTFTIQFLLRYYHVTREETALKQACLSLDKMIEGGIYDQVGGGFARYSTDGEWLAPHFEKMLYDNALLISVLSEAYQATKNERYAGVIAETIAFVQRELLHPSSGFYSALDADSEGVEGKFYTWDHEDVIKVLGPGAELFCEFFDITPGGNWEGKNILRIKKNPAQFSAEKNMSLADLNKLIMEGKALLLEKRALRPRPALDDKIILGWNALMNSACSKAFAATGREEYRQLAVENMRFLLTSLGADNDHEFFHNWKDGTAKNPAFLDDYAYLIRALLDLHEITSEQTWLMKAREIAESVATSFSEEETGFFFFTHKDQRDVILRKKEVYDGAVPSGNAMMMYNLQHLSILFDQGVWRQRVEKCLLSLGQAVVRYPTSFGVWACLLLEIVDGTKEIAVIGKNFKSKVEQLLGYYLPHKVVMGSDAGREDFPILMGKTAGETALIYLCKQYSCLKPVSSMTELLKLVNYQE